MKVYVGRTYRARCGVIETLVENTTSSRDKYPLMSLRGETYTRNGKHFVACTASPYDLVEEVEIIVKPQPQPVTVKVWFNSYPDLQGYASIVGFTSRDLADRHASSNRIACVEREFTYTPGEGLE